MELAQNTQSLADDIKASFDARMNFLGETSRNTKQFLQNAREKHKAMATKLHADLRTFTEGMRRTVNRQQAAVRRECQAAHDAWHKLREEMLKRRRNPTDRGAKAKKDLK